MGSLVIQKVNLNVSKKTYNFSHKNNLFFWKGPCLWFHWHEIKALFRRESCWGMGPGNAKSDGGIHNYIRLKVVVVSGFSPVNIRKKLMEIESKIQTKWPDKNCRRVAMKETCHIRNGRMTRHESCFLRQSTVFFSWKTQVNMEQTLRCWIVTQMSHLYSQTIGAATATYIWPNYFNSYLVSLVS